MYCVKLCECVCRSEKANRVRGGNDKIMKMIPPQKVFLKGESLKSYASIISIYSHLSRTTFIRPAPIKSRW